MPGEEAMNQKHNPPRPLIALRVGDVDQILGEDEFLATEVANMRDSLAQYGIVLARRNEPLVSKVEAQRKRRQKHADAGFCMYSKKHGKATHGTRCDACYEVNQVNLRARREKARTIKAIQAAKREARAAARFAKRTDGFP
jgi:hypothetical protein